MCSPRACVPAGRPPLADMCMGCDDRCRNRQVARPGAEADHPEAPWRYQAMVNTGPELLSAVSWKHRRGSSLCQVTGEDALPDNRRRRRTGAPSFIQSRNTVVSVPVQLPARRTGHRSFCPRGGPWSHHRGKGKWTVPATGEDVAEACPHAEGAQGKCENACVCADAQVHECVCVHVGRKASQRRWLFGEAWKEARRWLNGGARETVAQTWVRVLRVVSAQQLLSGQLGKRLQRHVGAPWGSQGASLYPERTGSH